MGSFIFVISLMRRIITDASKLDSKEKAEEAVTQYLTLYKPFIDKCVEACYNADKYVVADRSPDAHGQTMLKYLNSLIRDGIQCMKHAKGRLARGKIKPVGYFPA